MAYEIEFRAKFTVADPEVYINDCCWGGDVIRNKLLPVVRAGFRDVQTSQEDWGWFIWMKRGTKRISIDIFCDDKEGGTFRIRIAGSQKGWINRKPLDDSEVESIKNMVINEIGKFGQIERVERISV
jgi:hypothetical protein